MDKLNKSLDSWASIVKLNTHQELARVSFLSILRSSVIVSGFSNWLLLINGAVIALYISDLDSVHAIISVDNMKILLYSLVVSGIFGFIAKCISLYINIFININDEINKLIVSIFERFNEQKEAIKKVADDLTEPPEIKIDIDLVLKEISEPLPRFYKKKFLKAIEKGKKDPLFGYKKSVRLYIYQTLAVFLQMLFFVSFVLLIACSLK